MADSMRSEPEKYTWRQGKFEISVSRDGDQWRVQSTSSGRLFGPRQVLYDARHRMAKHAAWDVMACVIRTTSDEDEGVRVGRSAARWMRDIGSERLSRSRIALVARRRCLNCPKSKRAAGSSSGN